LTVRIRLKRMGRKKRPFYRLVAAHGSNPRDGEVIERLGEYNPTLNPVHFEIKQDRVEYWLSVGAQPSEPVARLLGENGVLPKVVKVPNKPGVSKKEKKAAQKA
jgi:small subunit ribosomal protein S16